MQAQAVGDFLLEPLLAIPYRVSITSQVFNRFVCRCFFLFDIHNVRILFPIILHWSVLTGLFFPPLILNLLCSTNSNILLVRVHVSCFVSPMTVTPLKTYHMPLSPALACVLENILLMHKISTNIIFSGQPGRLL